MIEYAFPYGNSSGMTLRDYFAAQVLPCLITQSWDEDCDANYLAQEAYAYADAMMIARGLDLT